ncbi:MAG: methylmalonyl-CoA epimerase [Dehalococcoidales bacterium]|nr:methylmalonyl-CoA epimerase [Dehalococcoidales bacterium]
MINKVSHIGIAVNSIDAMLKLYTESLGLKLQEIEILAEQKVRTAIIPVGESKIELLESTDPEGPIAKFIEKRGEGLHHIALEVSDLRSALGDLKQKNIPLIDLEPRRGVENTSIAFLHPKESKVLLELVEAKK